jgi:hypothetical protein
VAESNRTLWVAVAGIAATALVGLAGTAASWWSARDDRAAQSEVAREERTYDQRVLVYLDAMTFMGQQLAALHRFWKESELHHAPIYFDDDPPVRLRMRLTAFGSPRAAQAFQRAEAYIPNMPLELASKTVDSRVYIDQFDTPVDQAFEHAVNVLTKKSQHFQEIVHKEVG